MCDLREPFPLYLDQLVDAESSVQLGQLGLVFAAEEGDELLQQSLLIVPPLRRGGGTQELVQLRGDALAAERATGGTVKVSQSGEEVEREDARATRSHPLRHPNPAGRGPVPPEPAQPQALCQNLLLKMSLSTK